MHIRYCKYALGLHAKASNSATLGELGRCSIAVDITLAIIKYVHRLSAKTLENTILKSALGEATHMTTRGKKSWMKLACSVYREHATNIPNTSDELTKADCRKIKQSLIQSYSIKWLQTIQTAPKGENTGKLSTYCHIKTDLIHENYLKDVHIKEQNCHNKTEN